MLNSVSVLVLLTSVSMLVMLTGVVMGVLTLIWSIYDVGMYCKSSCLQWVQSLSALESCIYLLSLEFQLFLQFWG